VKVTRPIAASMAVMALTLAACGRGGDSNANAGSSGSAAPSKTAVMLKTAANPYWENVGTGAKDGAKQTGAKVTVQSAQNESDSDGQSTLLSTMASAGYDCFAVAPITATNLIQPLAGVGKATIVNIDSAIDANAAKAAGVNIATFISSNSEKAGQMAGQEMAKLLGGKGKVAVIGGLSGDANSNARSKGFTDAATSGGLTVVQTVAADWDREKALNAADQILRSTPDLGGFYAANDTMALGAVQAAQNAKNTTVKVIGTDGDDTALQSIQSGGLSATVSQYPYVEGLMGVEACQAAAAGKHLPAHVDAPLALITKDNADKALSSFPKPFDSYTDPFTDLLGK